MTGAAVKETPKDRAALAGVAFTLVCLGLGVVNLVAGSIKEDEGWYLYAAKSAMDGRLPYVDFAYTQTPVLPYVYGPVQLVWPGMLSGRVVSLGFAVAGLALALWMARRLGGLRAVVVTGSLVMLNLWAWYYLSLVTTYALAGFFLLGGFALLVAADRGDGPLTRWGPVGAGVLLALAVGTRASCGPAAVVVVLTLLLLGRYRQGLLTLAGGLVAGAVVLLPFVVLDAEAFWVNTFAYHMGIGDYLPPETLAFNRRSELTTIVLNWGVPVLLIAVGAVFWVRQHRRVLLARLREQAVVVALALATLSVFVVHLFHTHNFGEYQVLPSTALALMAGLATTALPPMKPIVTGILAAALVVVVVATNDGARWEATGGQLPLEETASLGDEVAALVPEDSKVLTLRTFVAIEAQRDVPEGLEMSIFSCFPDQTASEAARFHRINPQMLREMVDSGEYDAVVVGELDTGLTGYNIPLSAEAAAAQRSALERVLRRRYVVQSEHEEIGQFHETFRIYRRRP